MVEVMTYLCILGFKHMIEVLSTLSSIWIGLHFFCMCACVLVLRIHVVYNKLSITYIIIALKTLMLMYACVWQYKFPVKETV